MVPLNQENASKKYRIKQYLIIIQHLNTSTRNYINNLGRGDQEGYEIRRLTNKIKPKKSRIRETKHLSTDADGWMDGGVMSSCPHILMSSCSQIPMSS